MCNLSLEVGWQVDDVDGIEGTLLGTDTAADAEAFADEGDTRGIVDFDTEFAGTDD